MDKAVAAWLLWEAGGFVILAFVFKGHVKAAALMALAWMKARL